MGAHSIKSTYYLSMSNLIGLNVSQVDNLQMNLIYSKDIILKKSFNTKRLKFFG